LRKHFFPTIPLALSHQSPSLTPPIAPPRGPPRARTRRKHLRDLNTGHFPREARETAGSTAFATSTVGARRGRRHGRLVAVDVLAVDVLGARDPGAALVAAGVALLEAVDF
jgi:hypothetical protein